MPRKLSYYPEINYGITSLEPTHFDLATAEDVVTVVESSSEPNSTKGEPRQLIVYNPHLSELWIRLLLVL